MNFAAILGCNLLIALLSIVDVLFGIFGLFVKNDRDAQKKIKQKIIHSFPADNTAQSDSAQVMNTK